MGSALPIMIICVAIALLLIWRAYAIIQSEKGITERGSEPGKGDHIIHAEYSSGLSGHSTTYKISRDPQAYAKMFVPKQKRTKK